MYIVLAGQGTMTIENEPVTVRRGDMILNPAHGKHGLVNDSDADIDLLVIQIGLGKESTISPGDCVPALGSGKRVY